LKIPILPFKLIGFTNCLHVISFLQDEEYSAIEFMKYTNSVSGEGIELILTDNNNNQIIFANSPCNYLNIIKSGRNAYRSEIELEVIEKMLVNIKLSCKSELYHIQISFESLFPNSDIRAGKVDPRNHNGMSMPFMYSSQGSVGKKADIYVNGRKIEVLKAEDPFLSSVNGLQSYISKNFALAVFSEQDKSIQLTKKMDNEILYQTSHSDIISIKEIGNIVELKYSNYIDKCCYHFIYSDCEHDILQQIVFVYDTLPKITVKFVNETNSEETGNTNYGKTIVGIAYLEFDGCKESFTCNYHYKIEKRKLNNKEERLVSLILEHTNEDWIEKKRVMEIETLYIVDSESKLVNEVKNLKFLIHRY
jgi:hypothetical protein